MLPGGVGVLPLAVVAAPGGALLRGRQLHQQGGRQGDRGGATGKYQTSGFMASIVCGLCRTGKVMWCPGLGGPGCPGGAEAAGDEEQGGGGRGGDEDQGEAPIQIVINSLLAD